MRVVSHTCSNTEIVCALGCERMLVGIDQDSDFPIEVCTRLPKLGRDLELDIEATRKLRPDLVLTSLTVPGHERIVDALRAEGLPLVVLDPIGLDGVYASIVEIAEVLGMLARGRTLVAQMQQSMPPVEPRGARAKVLVEWWPKPVIAPVQLSWVNQIIELAGGINPFLDRVGKSAEISDADARAAAPDAIVMSWCGVKLEKYRADVVLRRPGWEEIPALKRQKIFPVTEAHLGRPGPRLVQGYEALRDIISNIVIPA